MSAWRSWIRFQHIHRRLDVICRHVVAGREMHAEQDLRAFDPVNCARCGDDRGAQIGAPASPIWRSLPIRPAASIGLILRDAVLRTAPQTE